VELTGPARDGAADAAPSLTGPEDAAIDDGDLMAWKLPLVCKDCKRRFEVPYRHFQAGVVFHCPHCRGSFVPTRPMCKTVQAAFGDFFMRRLEAKEELAKLGHTAEWRERQALDHAAFCATLERIADQMRPAGKMVRKGWLAGMFT
jgi:hypothetical protein